ncbi:ATP-binding cassette domain-containing protein, partial [Herbaspirillum sp. HC18]
RVRLNGRDVTGAPAFRMQAAGLARSFQITSLFFALTVAENLRLGAQRLESRSMLWLPVGRSVRARERVGALLEQFQLSGKADYLAGALSHGEQRRLEIAVALAAEPKILLLDEPTQGMSHGDTEATAGLIRALA